MPPEDRPRAGLPERAFDELDDLLFFFGTDGTLRFWNRAVEEVTGRSSDELRSTTPADFVEGADHDRLAQHVRNADETGEARTEVMLERSGDEAVPYEFISKRVTDDDGAVLGRIGLGREISEQKRYERRIERQNERLEHFAEVLSHDLRTPLNVAKGNLELLAETGEARHYETARRALERMDSLVTDVLTLAQTGEDIALSEYDRVDLGAVAREAWSLIEMGEATLAAEGTATVEADASRLQQVFANLFRNAVEHGDDEVTVRVGLLADAPGFFVADDGPGVPADERDAVFDAGHSTKADGTGFGLATVTQIADAHGWTVRVTDSASGGARFEVVGVDGVVAGEERLD